MDHTKSGLQQFLKQTWMTPKAIFVLAMPPPAKIYLYSKFSINLAIITMSSACFIDLETASQGSSRNVLINVSAIWCL